MYRLSRAAACQSPSLQSLRHEGILEACRCEYRGYAEDGSDAPTTTDAPTTSEQPNEEEESQGRKRSHRGRRYTRRETGSWNNSNFVIEAGQAAPIWPANVPIYDLQTQAPFLFDQFNPVFDAYKRLREENPEEFQKLLVSQTAEVPPPREGASKILQWEVNVVFDMDPNTKEAHPLNKKTKCRVYLRDLQQEFNLSDGALQLIARICGARYDPNKGLLTLTSEKYRDRELNRLEIVDMLNELVKEGQKMFPSPNFKESINLTAMYEASIADSSTAEPESRSLAAA